MAILITAFVLGLMGSLHCVGMCGPLALSLPLRGNSLTQKFMGGLLWSLGRVVTYGIMGAFFGLIGSGFQMIGYQKIISIVMGSVMILSVILPLITDRMLPALKLPYTDALRKAMQPLFREKNAGALFLIGLLNGLLPCGLVYLAIAGAIGTSDLLTGILYMVLFGAGTIPMLLFVAMMGNVITASARQKINRVVPWVLVVIGLIFILRGLTLGIPYLSPAEEKMHPEAQINRMNTPAGGEALPSDTLLVKPSCCGGE